jgi:hypothetical protein
MRRRRDDGETRRGHRRERREHAHRHDRRKGDPIPREHARQPSDDGRRGLRGGGRGRL